VNINDTKVTVMVDTGASANVINEHTYMNFCDRPAIVETDKQYYSFGGTPLDLLGCITVNINWRERSRVANFLVIRGNHRNLLGKQTAQDLGLVTLHLDGEPAQSINAINQPLPPVRKLIKEEKRDHRQARKPESKSALKNS
jgi:hypothetical protein